MRASLAIALVAACGTSGSDDGSSPTASSSTSSSSSSGGSSDGATSSSSSGATSSSSSGAASSSSGGTSSGCPIPTADTICSLPNDTAGFSLKDSAVVTDASCKTSFYAVAMNNSTYDSFLRRYTVTSISPCVIERDMAVPEVPALEFIGVDDAGNVYQARYLNFKRIYPGTTITCANPTNLNLSNYQTTGFAVAPDGTVGFASFVSFGGGSTELDRKIVKMTADATSCSIAPLALSGVTITGAASVAIDGKGRLHIVDAPFNAFLSHGRIVIVDASGAFVSEYALPTPGSQYWDPRLVTRCHRGMCIADNGVVAVTDDGTLIGRGSYGMPGWVTTPTDFRSNGRGPLFHFSFSTSAGAVVLKDR